MNMLICSVITLVVIKLIDLLQKLHIKWYHLALGALQIDFM